MNTESNRPNPSNSPGLPVPISPVQSNQRTAPPNGKTSAATPSGEGLTPAFILRVYCKCWKWAVPLGVLLAVVSGAAVWYFHVPQFEATALIKIESETPFIAFENGRSNHDADRYVQTQIELLRSQVVIGPVLGRPDVASIQEIRKEVDPVKFVQEQLQVKQVGKSELYQVSYISPSAEDAATVANASVAEYLVMQDREDRQRSQIVIEVLEKERLERGIKVEQLRKRVVDLAKQLTGRDPFGQGVVMDVAAFSSATSIYQNLTEAEVGVEMLKAELQGLSNAPIVAADKAEAAGLLELEVANRTDVRQLEARLAEIRDKVADIKSKPRVRIGDTWKNDPEYRQYYEQFRLTSAELQKLMDAAGKELRNQRMSQRKVEQQRLIAAKEQELASMRKRCEMLSAKFDEHLQELKSGGAQSVELEFAKAELEREQRVFELIAARKLALQTEMRAPARVSLMQSAKAPAVALVAVPIKLLFVSCFASLVVPLGLAVAHETIVRRVSSPDQLRQESLLPVLGEVTRFPARHVSVTQKALSPAQQRQFMVYAESIDSLRTNLMLTENLGVPGQSKVVAICSAASGEGKTSVATSLAMSIAEATKQPTLILDADLRSPDVGKFFEKEDCLGVTELLAGKADLTQVIHRVGTTQAYILPAGKRRVNPHHVLQGAKIKELLEILRDKFCTIVIDTPPVLSASESLVYAQAADLVVFCSLADISRARQVRIAVDRLQSTGANISGTVLSGVPFGRYVYQYGTYSQ
jgi:capsular exopolysaccharide synthesis family protein